MLRLREGGHSKRRLLSETVRANKGPPKGGMNSESFVPALRPSSRLPSRPSLFRQRTAPSLPLYRPASRRVPSLSLPSPRTSWQPLLLGTSRNCCLVVLFTISPLFVSTYQTKFQVNRFSCLIIFHSRSETESKFQSDSNNHKSTS